MIKKSLVGLLCIIISCFFMCSCSVETVDDSDGKELSSTEETTGNLPEETNSQEEQIDSEDSLPEDTYTEEGLEWEENEFTDGIPVVDFGVITLITPSEDAYLVMIENVTEAEVNAYKGLVAEKGFESIGGAQDGSSAECYSNESKVVAIDYSTGIMTIMVQYVG